MSEIFNADGYPRVTVVSHTGHRFQLGNLLSYTSSRSLDNPVSQASIEMRGWRLEDTGNPKIEGKYWADIMGLYDLVIVERVDADGRTQLEGRYLLDAPIETDVPTQDGPIKGVSFGLVGIGEALIRYKILWHPWLTERSNIAGLGYLMRAKGKLPLGRPHEVLRSIYSAFVNDDYLFELADRTKLNKAFDLRFEEIRDSLAQIAFSAMGAETSLWDTLKRYCDAPWNEFFVDIPYEDTDYASSKKPLKEAIYLRSTPFDPESWARLYNTQGWGFDLDDGDLMGSGISVGPSSRELHNFFWTSASTPYTAFNQVAIIRERSGKKLPRYDVGSIRRFGLRNMEQNTSFVQLPTESAARTPLTPEQKVRAGTQSNEYWELLDKRTSQLHLWNGYPHYWRGMVQTRPRVGGDRKNGMRMGGILRDRRTERQYYITQITQSWSFMSPWLTQATLSMGHYPKARLDWWNKRKEQAISDVIDVAPSSGQ